MHLHSVADAVARVKRNGTDIFHTQVTRAAYKGAISKGWHFSFEDEIPRPPLVATAPPPPPSSARAVVSSYFRPISSLLTCACCGDNLLGDILACTNCNHNVHALCTQCGHCFKCVCRVCNQPPCSDMRACKTCKHLVHTTCRHVHCTSPSVWRWYAKHAHPGHGSTHRPPRRRGVGSNPHGKPAAHGCNMPMG